LFPDSVERPFVEVRRSKTYGAAIWQAGRKCNQIVRVAGSNLSLVTSVGQLTVVGDTFPEQVRERTRASSVPESEGLDRFLLRAALIDPSPKLLVDGNGQVLWASPGADGLLQPPLPLCIKRGKVVANEGSDQRALSSFLETVGEEVDRLMLIGKAAGRWVLVRGWAEGTGEERQIFLTCALSQPLRSVESSGLCADFGITKTECAVLDGFARLEKPREIAERLQVSLSTVRNHLKQIYTKLGINSAVELMRLARTYCDN
jgi:DNA-binding CsgD family transcriptional regulator